jgi:1,4-dihydroxy-6-naphthoate synthase
MNQKLSLAYSTCPNDTYIFYALAHGKIDTGDLEFDIRLNDVEHLNQAARRGENDVSKLSFAAIGHLTETYALLESGAALGRGCGPMVVARPGTDLGRMKTGRVAVPGLWTTANLLLELFSDTRPETVPMVFDQIMPSVAAGETDLGVIIHEGRFTYQNHGLKCLVDLGEWWESETRMPIPLGGIAVRRDIPREIACQVETAIRESIAFTQKNPGQADNYIRSYAQELSEAVIRQHIDLYVNEFSTDIGEEGATAIDRLFLRARSKNIIPDIRLPLFACNQN